MDAYIPLFVLLTGFSSALAFFPNHFTDIKLGKGTLTHSDITEEGILRAVAAFFEETPRPGSAITKGELTGMDNISARKLFAKYYGADASEKRFQDAIDGISFANNVVDVEYENKASWNFNGETIQIANELMIGIREKIIDIFKATNPQLDQAIDLTGQFLHIMQMFYSNTNWVEISGARPYYSLGIRGKPLYGTAPPPMETCKSCWDNNQSNCRKNLIVLGQMLTSGYKGGQDEKKPFKDPKTSMTGKCSHGGKFDTTSKTIAALGGINKDSNSIELSPHHHLHAAAAMAAIDHTAFFFEGKDYGLRHIIGNANYQNLLQLRAGNSMALVIDYSGSMSEEIEAVKLKISDIIKTVSGTLNEPSTYIVSLFNDPLTLNKVSQFESGEDTLAYLQTVRVNGGDDCPEYCMDGIEKALTLSQPNSEMYVFTDASAKDPEKQGFITTLAGEKNVKITFLLTGDCSRKKRSTQRDIDDSLTRKLRTRRSTNGLDLYKSLARKTGGSVYQTSKAEIAEVANLIKESARGSTVTILKKTIPATDDLNFTFPIDVTVRRIDIKIITSGGTPSHTLISPNGNKGTDNITVSDVGNGIRLIKVESPVFGEWRISRQDSKQWNMEISAQSTLDISTTFVQKNPNTGFEYEIVGRPIAGDNATLIAKLPSLDMAKTLDRVILLDTLGSEFVRHEGFTRVEGRQGSAVFRRQFELPGQSFHIAVSGTDSGGNEFLRLVAENIVPVDIQLKILPINGSLFVNEQLSIPFEVTNKGDASSSIIVSLKDDQSFAQLPLEKTFQIEPFESKSDIFVLQAGSTEGVTTTVTVSAKSQSSDSGNSQFVVRRFTTTKRIVRETDTKAPVCDIVDLTGTCDVTIVDPCFCSVHQWSATAEVGDDGFGLFQVSSSITTDGEFNVQNFTMGHNIRNGTIQANISASCCDAVAYINVVDMAGNIGQCVFNVITDNGEPVTNTSIIDMVKSRNQCTESDETTQIQFDKTTQIQDGSVTVIPEEQNGIRPEVIVGITLGIAAVIILITVVVIVVIKKRNAQKCDMTVKFVDE